jgi:histidyl-tRNA synthetase
VLDEEARRRLHSNPLRLLDSKNPAMQVMLEAAPKLMDFLGQASLEHFNGVKAMLDANGVAYRINPRLVRGMDYYNLTVFEFVTQSLGSQGTICGGGRYDYLIEQIGGKAAPAVGWALGMERVLELIKEQGHDVAMPVPDVYAVIPESSALPVALKVLQQLRAAGIRVQMHSGLSLDGMGSMKSQFKKADASGARFALIFGATELAQGCVALKPLRASTDVGKADAQSLHKLDEVASWVPKLGS